MPYCDIPDGRLYYETAGDASKPAVIFIHAGVADSRMWNDQIDAFAERYYVVRYDWRGAGKTETTHGVTFSNRADLRALMDHLNIARAALIGCSRGGMIAIDTTLESPERVGALVMVGSAPGGYDDVEIPPEEEEPFRAMAKVWEETHSVDRVNEMEIEAWLDGVRGTPGRVQGELRERMREMNRNVLEKEAEETKPIPLEPPAAQRLGEITIPVLAIWGNLDETYAEKAAQYMTANIANAREYCIVNTAHMSSMEQPELFNRVVMEFLTSAGWG